MLLLGAGADSASLSDEPSALLDTRSLLANVGLAKASIDLYSMTFVGVSAVSRRSWHVRTSPMASFGVKLSSLSYLESAVKFDSLEGEVFGLFVDTEGKEFWSNEASEGGLLWSLGSSGKEAGDFLPF